MPRDLFGNVTRPSISIGNRKWYTVPVSLLSHAVVIAMIVIAPILAAPMMPGVLDNSTIFRIIDLVPPTPPLPPAIREHKPKPVVDPGISVVAPTGISDEPEVIHDAPATTVGVVDGIDNIDRDLPPPPVVIQQAPPEPVRVGHTIRQPVKTRGADPVYPPIAQSARVQGIVIIEATLTPEGRVANARILRSVPLLDQAALDAVRTWEYTPTMLNGVPVPVIMTVTVQFTLSR
jgi:periplasmic protein TonB